MRQEVLEILEHNSKVTVDDLATILEGKIDDIANEIAAMEKEKIICGYHTLINWEKTNNEKVTALIEVKVTPQRGQGFDKIAERIYRFKEVKSVYLMSGGFDLTVILEGKTMKEVALFVGQKLAPLESVLSTATHFVLKKYKDHGIILEETRKDERMVVTP
ncbi:Lrp/AsnC family transcriptional regulator [Vallitalea pronyensis]|uniref:Lrp/AsnC family transcriptional regulator n=1 Tax=Vallitalea pronyensis TaxID=1348613 RepID=A0A8J8MP17_9FIRM|nr:Lrp/AsnC family transcriptional regulator [Vallitalea pronyensis]QUI25472.1 Lrp/AsnC family transcriptional regulator [Vallitalea pronyensis]